MNYETVHELSFYPVYEIYLKNNGTKIYDYLGVKSLEDKKFSLIKTEQYSKKCLENYYINSEFECPITQIYLESEKSYNYSSFHEIIIKPSYSHKSDLYTKYIYYTNNNTNNSESSGKLYSITSILDTNFHFKSELDSDYFEKLKRFEDNKIKNPLKDLKNYTKYADYICLLLLILCFINIFFEICDNRKFNYFKIINIFIEFALFFLYLFRYIKFIKVKTFFFDNEDIYKKYEYEYHYLNGVEYKVENNKTDKDYYFPKKYFNIDSFPITLLICLLIFNFIYAVIPEKCFYCCKCNIDKNEKICYCLKDDDLNLNKKIFIIFINCSFLFILFFIFDIINDNKIINVYNNMIYNWE